MNDYQNTITKEEIKDLPLTYFEGKIEVIDSLDKVKNAVERLKQSHVLGFDTETKPAFKKGVHNKVAVLQFSTGSHAFLFQIHKIGLPDGLKDILTDKDIIKPGIALHDDIKALQKLHHFEPSGFLELQSFVKDYGIENSGLKKLAAIVLNIRISKSQRLTNWENDELTEAQQRYAATDAWVCFEIYKKLISL
jgi:ribonuclease D